MKRFIAAALFAAAAFTGAATAQTYPDHESRTVNDFAGLLSPEAEAGIGADLDRLREETGIEMTVVTLSRKETFAPDQDLETFAKGLFDQWGVGGEGRDDGILFLILHADRQTRLELGGAYSGDWQFEANSVVNGTVVPAFRDGDFEGGIRAGVTAAADRVARPFHAEAPPPAPAAKAPAPATAASEKSGGGISGWWAALIVVPVPLLILWSKMKAKLAKCPKCGARGLSVTSRRVQEPTESASGHGEKTTTCASCGYSKTESYTIARKQAHDNTGEAGKAGKSGFGGGKSGGGGASGEW